METQRNNNDTTAFGDPDDVVIITENLLASYKNSLANKKRAHVQCVWFTVGGYHHLGHIYTVSVDLPVDAKRWENRN